MNTLKLQQQKAYRILNFAGLISDYAAEARQAHDSQLNWDEFQDDTEREQAIHKHQEAAEIAAALSTMYEPSDIIQKGWEEVALRHIKAVRLLKTEQEN